MCVYLYILKMYVLRVQKNVHLPPSTPALNTYLEGVGKRKKKKKRPRPFLELDLGKAKMFFISLSDSKSHQNFIAENLSKKYIMELPLHPFLLCRECSPKVCSYIVYHLTLLNNRKSYFACLSFPNYKPR